jgi:carbon-monoxide dehydrogenase medium subunit
LIALEASVRIVGRNGVRVQTVADLIRGPYETTLTAGEIIMGFDIPAPEAPLRWGFAKVVRKSGAFANSIAIVTRQSRDGPVTVVLGAAGPRPISLPAIAEEIRAGKSPDDLRAAIAADLDVHVPDADAYQMRVHTTTILRAVRDMQAQ